LRATACSDSNQDHRTGFSSPPGNQMDGRGPASGGQSRLVRLFSGYRLSRWSAAAVPSRAIRGDACGLIRSVQAADRDPMYRIALGVYPSSFRYASASANRRPQGATLVLKRTEPDMLVLLRCGLSRGCACASAPTDTESATVQTGHSIAVSSCSPAQPGDCPPGANQASRRTGPFLRRDRTRHCLSPVHPGGRAETQEFGSAQASNA